MTAHLSPLQRQVLEQLAHIRVAPEDAWLTRDRLSQLVLGSSMNPEWQRMGDLLQRMRQKDLVRFDHSIMGWRITDEGREVLG